MSILILHDIVDVGDGPREWRVMMNGGEYVCSNDEAVLRTRDHRQAMRFLAGTDDEAALQRAERFLRAVTPLALNATSSPGQG